MSSAVYILTLLSVFAVVQFGECNPKCYICDSETNINCVHPKDHKMEMHECSANNLGDMKTSADKLGITSLASYFEFEIVRSDFKVPLHCVKTVVKVQEKEIIIRGCQMAPKENLDFCKRLLDERKDIVQHCSFCNEHGCNSAHFQRASMSLALIALLVPALIVL